MSQFHKNAKWSTYFSRAHFSRNKGLCNNYQEGWGGEVGGGGGGPKTRSKTLGDIPKFNFRLK